MPNKAALEFLKTLIKIYTRRLKELDLIKECSYSAFYEYLNIKEFVLHLKNLLYKLIDKEIIDNEPQQSE